MKQFRWAFVFFAFSVSLSATFAAETIDWSTSGQVTYSTSVTSIPLGEEAASTQINLSQFNSAAVAQAKGGNANEYTLSKVVLSINGSIYGSVEYVNNSSVDNTPKFKIHGTSALTFDNVSTSDESYSKIITYPTIAAGERYTKQISESGSGTVSTPEITSDLQRFIGNGTIATYADFPVDGYFSVYGTDYTSKVAVMGAADVSVTYYYAYNPVPEPSTLALLGFGCAAVLARRRRKAVVGTSAAGTVEKTRLEART